MSTLARVIFDLDTTPPSVPTVVAAVSQSTTTIRVTWAASTDTGGSGLAGYRVYRATTSGGTYSLISGTLSIASLSFDDTSLSASTTRYYRVSAVDWNNNESSQSAVASATTQGGSSGTPSPSGTIVFDARAGGAQSYQSLTTNAQILSRWDANRLSNGATQFFETNVDGSGTNARGLQWLADASTPAPGNEQEVMVNQENHTNIAPATGWYVQFKMRLGRVSGGSGTGTVGLWTLGGGNAHQKVMAMHTGDGRRYYVVMRPTDCKISEDNTSFSSSLWSQNPYDHPGEIQTITVYMQPSTRTLRAWRNDTLVLDQTGISAIATNAVLNGIEETFTTRLPVQDQVSYMWDTVIWYP